MSEQSVASARAAVLVYDDNNKKWVPSGSSSGLSKVHIYQHTVQGTFRVVGRKLHDHEVVINCAILKGLKYNQATATFHQWRDNRTVYGLNFSSKDDADAFAVAMLRAIEMLNQNNSVAQRPAPAPAPPVPQHAPQPIYQTIGSVSWSQDDVEHQRNRQNQQAVHYMTTNAVGSSSHPASPACAPSQALPPLQAQPLQNAAQAPPQPQPSMGHHRTSSAPTNNGVAAPPAPPPPPPGGTSGMSVASLGTTGSGSSVGGGSTQSLGGGAPSGGPPPPPPPPPPGGQQGNGEDGAPLSLAAAIASAKLKKSANKQGEGSDTLKKSQGSSSGSSGVPMMGMASMMDEMRGTLAKRRAQVENSQSQDGEMSSDSRKNWDKQGSTNGTSPSKGASSGAESPKSGRGQRISSLGDTEALKVNGVDVFDVDKLKQEIMAEIRREVSKMKTDIIEAIKIELNRR